jgi:predicted oxidoreductase
MKTQPIGRSDIVSTRMSYGCMRISFGWDPGKVTAEQRANGRKAVIAAWEAGYRLFDHADIYCAGMGETIYGEALREVPEIRKDAIVATKCGIRFPGNPRPESPQRYDFSGEYIVGSAEQSLKRLGMECIDIYQLHRPDILMDPAEVCAAFEKLHKAGKVKWFGVSNFLPTTVEALQAGLGKKMPLVVQQVEIHPARLDCFVDGTLDQCLVMRMTPLAWSPIGGGLFGDGGKVPSDHPRREILEKLLVVLDTAAKKYGVSRTAIVLAWLMRHPSKIIPIVGSANPDRIRDAAKADDVDMDREDWYRIYIAARGERLP